MNIEGVRFKLINPAKVRETFLVESADTWNQNTPVTKGLNDRHLGTSDERFSCLTCGQKSFCPGHMGHLELCKPCFIPNMLDHVIKVLRSVCPDCSGLLIPERDIKEKSLDWVADAVTSHAAYKFCGQNEVDEDGEPKGCGCHRGSYSKIDGLHIKGVLYVPIDTPEPLELPDDKGKEEESETATEEEKSSRRRKTSSTRKKKQKFQERQIIITPEKAHNILRKISVEDAALMGFPEDSHPSWMIWTVLPVIPPPERPTMTVSPQRRGEDDLTYALFNIFKANQELKKKIAQGCHASKLSANYELLAFRVATYTTNDLQKQPRVKQRSGREMQGVSQKLKGKEGLPRQNMMGKRVDFSGRTVITADPTLSAEELGVPLEIAMILTKPVPVTAENFDECWERVLRGPYVYGGANSIIKFIKGRKYVVDLKLTKDRSELVLRKGMVIEVHLEDGDWVLFNRQPTLHRMGMMGHRVRVVPGSTFRLNESTTTPYNADFDGDEMNTHAPQLQATIAEVKWLCAVSNNFLSPKNSGATIGLVQDALLAGYLLSLDDTRVDREVFFDCVMAMKHGWSRNIPAPVGRDADNRPMWTGKQLISMAVPQELNIEHKDVRIYNGELVAGHLTKSLLGNGTGTLLHIAVQQLGEDRARDFLDNLHDLNICWLKHRGFTFSLRDITIPDRQKQEFHSIVNEAQTKVEEYLERVIDPDTKKLTVDEDIAETKINQILNQTISRAGKEVLPSLPRSNLADMAVKGGSKGKPSNITQMVGYVGQQNVHGGRIPCGMKDRTLPHFKRNDYGLKSRGWVKHCYEEGLDPQEFFMHAAGGREGIVDTAIKTAKTGYALRQITNAMSDIVVDELFRACNSRGTIVQFMYAGDLITPGKLVSVKIEHAALSSEAFGKRYYWNNEKPETIEEQQLWKDRKFVQNMTLLPDGYLETIDDGLVKIPVNIDTIILNAQVRFKCGKFAESEMYANAQKQHPDSVVDTVNGLILRLLDCWSFDTNLHSERRYALKMLNVIVRSRLASKRVVEEYQLSHRALEWVCDKIVESYELAIIDPGEAVGSLSAQSNGEPQQQMTLNTFHFAGISAQNVTLGVPRIKEIIHCTRDPKNVTTTVFLKPELDSELAYQKAWHAKSQISDLTVGKALQVKASVDWEPRHNESRLRRIIFGDNVLCLSGYVLKLVFDPVTLRQHGMSFGAVTSLLRENLNDGETTQCIFRDSDSQEPIVLIRAKYSNPPDTNEDNIEEWKKRERMLLIRYYQQFVDPIRLCGIDGMKSIYVQKDRRRGGLQLSTDCRDLLSAINSCGDPGRCYSNHPLENLRVLGVEAARPSIIMEIRKVYRHYGLHVGARHISMIADVMTFGGGLMSLDRHGINHGEFNTLAQAAFEEFSDVMTKAAVSAKEDELCDNTSRIMLGREIRLGTGSFDLFLNKSQHEYLARKHHQRHRERQKQRRRNRAIQDRLKNLNLDDDGQLPSYHRELADPMSYAGSGFGIQQEDDFGDFSEAAIDEYNPSGANFSRFGVEQEYDPEMPEYNQPAEEEYDPMNLSVGFEPYNPDKPEFTPSFGFGADEEECTKVTDEGLKWLSGVHTINLCNTKVTDEGLKWLRGVDTINICNTKVTDEGLKWLSGVHSINLYNTKVTDEGLKWLSGIHTINLCNTAITDEGLKWLKEHGTVKIYK